jgi:DNA-directed RNA polymerase subunit N (RpoN/RPB10)
MASGLDSGTGVTIADKPGDYFPHTWPPEMSGNHFEGTGLTRVACRRMIVARGDDLPLEV